MANETMETKAHQKNGDGKPSEAPKAGMVRLIPLKIETMQVILIGDSPLICHAWDEKAKRMMRDKQMGKASEGKEPKDPVADFCNSLYWLEEKPKKATVQQISSGKFGFPTIAFKGAAVDACSHVKGITKVEARGAFHMVGDLVEIRGGKPRMREDMVRLNGTGPTDIRYRGEFVQWWVEILVRYNACVLSGEQIVNLLNVAGFGVGVGEHRPAKDGSNGMFHVATAEEAAELLKKRKVA